jgi:hypothetical protein
MLADVLVIAALVGAVWWWHGRTTQARHARDGGELYSLLSYDDLPPIGAFDPLPDETGMDDYVEGGLQRLTSYLTGRDQNA